MVSRRISRNSFRGLPAAIVFVAPFAVLFLVTSQKLPLDLDEAYYVLGGTLFTSGKLPYRDFFFPQTPLSAIVFGLWSSVFGDGFVIARYLGAILTTAIGLVIGLVVRRRAGIWYALVAVAYYGLSIQVIFWMPRMKTYGMSSLLAVLSLVTATGAIITKKKVFIAGALAALAVSCRLLFVPIPLLVLLAILLRADVPPTSRREYFTWAVLGIAVGLAPVLVLALSAPKAFYFSNVSYHALRDGSHSLVGDFSQKLHVLKGQFGLGGSGAHGTREAIQFLILVPASIATLFGRGRLDRHLLVFPLAVVLLLLVSLLPTPTYRQYMVTILPPAIIAVSLLAVRGSRMLLTFQAILLIPYAFVCYRTTLWLLTTPQERSPDSYDAVGHALQELTKPHEMVASMREHFLVAAERPIEPCSYNCFARRDWSQLSREQVKTYHLCSNDDMVQAIRSGKVKAFVAYPNEDLGLSAELEHCGWKQVSQPPATIWISPE